MRLKRMQKVTAALLAAGLAVPLTAGSTLVQAKQPQQKSESHVNYQQENDNDSLDQAINEIQKEKLARWQQFYRQKALSGEKQLQSKAAKNRGQETAESVKPKATKPAATSPVAAQAKKPSVEQTAARKAPTTVETKPTADRKATSNEPVRQLTQATAQKTSTVQETAPVRQAAKPEISQNQSGSAAAAHPVQKAVQPSQTTASAQSFVVTAYSLSGRTATGVNLGTHSNARVVAVDPSLIPLGSKVTIEGLGTYTAADTGGAIKGNRIDVHMPSNQQAVNFGRRTLNVTVQR